MPRGSRFAQAIGGPATWSDEVAAINAAEHRIRQAIHALIGTTAGKRVPDAKPVEPPEHGWQAKAIEKHRREQAKALRWMKRNKARGGR